MASKVRNKKITTKKSTKKTKVAQKKITKAVAVTKKISKAKKSSTKPAKKSSLKKLESQKHLSSKKAVVEKNKKSTPKLELKKSSTTALKKAKVIETLKVTKSAVSSETKSKIASEVKQKVNHQPEVKKQRSSFNSSIGLSQNAKRELDRISKEKAKALVDGATEQDEVENLAGLLDKRKAKLVEKYIKSGKEWKTLFPLLEEHAIDYKMSQEYRPQMAIKHKNMGIGYVMSVGHNKMLVCFEDGPKNLIMNYK